ncbi:MAG: SDR family oxidoreductase [Saprospiraceae bacterium]|nr:SDR family oxidoreductase [Saprospiraceae bacterium]
MFNNKLLDQKIILVTGGGSGIGFKIAENCLKYGAYVFIASRNEERLQAAIDQLEKYGKCSYVVCDIRSIENIQTVVERIKEEKGQLDILVNNAGGQFPSAAEDISYNGWNAVVNNNLNGTWHMTQSMAKNFFLPQGKGCVINIIANIYRGFPGMAHTGAARAGVDNITKTLAVEWGRKGVQINAIAPGVIKSTGLEQYPVELLKGITDRIPLQRLGTTQEVADLCIFLMSPMSKFITGETIYIDGGQRLWGDVFEVE